ncbi:MAG: hypothetical protein ACTTK0_00450 [Stomatobaculum sp.]
MRRKLACRSSANDATLGTLLTGWVEVGGKWYCLEQSGARCTRMKRRRMATWQT